ncbi:CBU_0592 family membrane protein [Hyphobacterium sp.]|uniref:CBU_0592 family membrane protein n=1 Tax=Hyphobacterium sp. TaxID=2004662 RepID=UPI003BA95911
MITLTDIIGFAGVACVLFAYFWQQTKGVRDDDWRHPVINGIGAVLLLISLIYKPNPASIAIEFAWFGISVVGLVRALRNRQRAKRAA